MTTQQFALKKDLDMLNDRVQELRRSYQLLEYFVQILQGYHAELKTQENKILPIFKRLDESEFNIDLTACEVMSHTKEFVIVNKKLDEHTDQFIEVNKRLDEHTDQFIEVNKHLDEHTAQFTEVNKKLDDLSDKVNEHSAQFTEVNKKLDKIIEHLAIK